MMRVLAYAALAALGLAAAASPAMARVWTDPAGRVTFEYPSEWTLTDESNPNLSYAIAGNADFECHVLAFPRPESANVSAHGARHTAANDAAFTDETWARAATGITTVFDGPPQVISRTSEKDTRFWPIQRAQLQATRLVHGAIQLRPGLELLTFCQTYEGADPMAAYDSLIRSVATPNDAALQAQAEQQANDRAAQQQAVQEAAAAAEAQNRANAEENRRRGNR